MKPTNAGVAELAAEPISSRVSVVIVKTKSSGWRDINLSNTGTGLEPRRLTTGFRPTKKRFLAPPGLAPTLADAQATILCRRTDSHLFATHSIFIGLVEEVTAREDIDPLLYLDGCYGSADI